ncbi:AAA family ATPase [Streptomyces sp. A3M-1-3]|nr:AAA family ATPase [Streptomyces sp. A3M-1-3]
MHTLRELLRAAAAGRGGSVLVEGEPGVGKSDLLDALLAEAAKLGVRAQHGAADELGSRFPLRAVLDCLSGGGAAADTTRTEIMRLLRGATGDARAFEAVQMGAMDLVHALIGRLCAEEPLVLVLDDLQWADDASLLVWHRLAKAAPGMPLLLAAACRPVPVRRELTRVRAGLAERGTMSVRLGSLTPQETTRLVEDVVGAPPGPRLRGRAALAGGNPRYLRELITGLAAEGQITASGGQAELPPAVDAGNGSCDALAGLAGLAGPAGPASPAVPSGPAVSLGPAGRPGLAGASGPSGLADSSGLAGSSGLVDAAGAAGAAGLAGFPGLAGGSGSSGPSAAAGRPGSSGLPGAAGPRGRFGPAGLADPSGRFGPPGLAGPSGLAGAAGSSGADGGLGFGGAGSVGFLQAMRGMLGFLGPDAYDTLYQASLLGTEFTVGELGVVVGRSARDLLGALSEPIAAGLLVDAGDRLRFRHAVLRESLYAGFPASVRSALHLDSARALAASGAAPATVAGQLLDTTGPLDGWALSWLVAAAQQLIAVAPAAAAALIERAIGQGRPHDSVRHVLEERLAEAALLLRRPESVGLLATLRDRDRDRDLDRAQDPDRRSALDFMLASALMIQGSTSEALAATEDALSAPGLSRLWRVRLAACQVLCRADLGQAAPACRDAEALVAEAAGLADPQAQAEAHHAMSYALTVLGRGRDAVAHAAQGIACARRTPAATDIELLLLVNHSDGLAELDDREAARQALEEARELAVRTGSTGRLAGIEARSAELHFRRGNWDSAVDDLERASARQVSDPWLPVLVHGTQALILGHRDQRPQALDRLSRLDPGVLRTAAARRYCGSLLLARSLGAEREGRIADALGELLPVLTDEFAAAMLHESFSLLPDVVRLALETGDTRTAEAAVAACEAAAAGAPDFPGPATAAVRCRGLFAQDPEVLGQAVAQYARGAWPLLLGQSLEDLAVAQAWRGDLAGSRASLGRAVDVYTELGARWDVARADARLRPLGVRRGSRTARRRPTTGWDALTPTELKVALLVAEGRSNPEIATELFLSPRTVQTHVSHILSKLGMRSRTEVAREVAREAVDRHAGGG